MIFLGIVGHLVLALVVYFIASGWVSFYDLPVGVSPGHIGGLAAIIYFMWAGTRKQKPGVSSDGVGPGRSITAPVVGVTFEGRQAVVAGLSVGQTLYLRRDPTNLHDANAIQVRTHPVPELGDSVGFMDRGMAAKLAPVFDRYLASQSESSYIAAVVVALTGTEDAGLSKGVRIRFQLPATEESPPATGGATEEPAGMRRASDSAIAARYAAGIAGGAMVLFMVFASLEVQREQTDQPALSAYRATSTPRPAPSATFTPPANLWILATATRTPRPGVATPTPHVVVEAEVLNVRVGPSTAWDTVEQITKGNTRPARARNPDGTWVAIDNRSGNGWLWVSAEWVRVSVPIASLPAIQYYDCEHRWYRAKPAAGHSDCPVQSISVPPTSTAWVPSESLRRVSELIQQCGWDNGCRQEYCRSKGWTDCSTWGPSQNVIAVECDGMCAGIEDDFDRAHCYDRCVDDYCRSHPEERICAQP